MKILSFGKIIILSLSLFALVLVMHSCTPKYFKPSHFNKMKWIEGKWQHKDLDVVISEQWKFEPDAGFEGLSIISIGRDTLFYEQVSIRMGTKRTIVFASKSGQVQIEESKPMKLIQLGKDSFTFETEDGSKTMRYIRKGKTGILVRITETIDEKQQKTKYQMNLIQ